jgi:hypothetical protein
VQQALHIRGCGFPHARAHVGPGRAPHRARAAPGAGGRVGGPPRRGRVTNNPRGKASTTPLRAQQLVSGASSAGRRISVRGARAAERTRRAAPRRATHAPRRAGRPDWWDLIWAEARAGARVGRRAQHPVGVKTHSRVSCARRPPGRPPSRRTRRAGGGTLGAEVRVCWVGHKKCGVCVGAITHSRAARILLRHTPPPVSGPSELRCSFDTCGLAGAAMSDTGPGGAAMRLKAGGAPPDGGGRAPG